MSRSDEWICRLTLPMCGHISKPKRKSRRECCMSGYEMMTVKCFAGQQDERAEVTEFRDSVATPSSTSNLAHLPSSITAAATYHFRSERCSAFLMNTSALRTTLLNGQRSTSSARHCPALGPPMARSSPHTPLLGAVASGSRIICTPWRTLYPSLRLHRRLIFAKSVDGPCHKCHGDWNYSMDERTANPL